jgi:DNA-binding NtrC family response regulator
MSSAPPAAGAAGRTYPEVTPEIDRRRVEEVLRLVGGNRSEAARRLGISRRALYRRLDSYRLR